MEPQATPQSGSKTCSKCHQEKAIDEFGINRRRPDGKQTYCKECARDYSRERRRQSGVSQHLVSRKDAPVTDERSRIITRFPPEN